MELEFLSTLGLVKNIFFLMMFFFSLNKLNWMFQIFSVCD